MSRRRLSDGEIEACRYALSLLDQRVIDATKARSMLGWAWVGVQIQKDIDREMRRRARAARWRRLGRATP